MEKAKGATVGVAKTVKKAKYTKNGVRKHSQYVTKKIREQARYEARNGVKMVDVYDSILGWESKKKEIAEKEIKAVMAIGSRWSDKEDEEVERLKEKELIAQAKDSYLAWVRLNMGADFVENPYNVYLILVAEWSVKEAEKGKDVNITISCPAQTGKSESVCKHLPSWFVGRHPNCETIVLTSDGDLAKSFGGANRQKAVDYWEKVFGIKIDKAFKSKTEVGVEGNTGVMRFKGITGTVVGRGAVLNVIDDPYPGEEYVNSKTLREKVISTVRNDVFTRARGKGKVGCIRFVIHTRRHEEDLIGVLDKEYIKAEESMDGIARKKWMNITIPYFAVSDKDPLGRKIGEPLCPERGFDVRWGLSKKSDVGLRAWNAQYQQNPMLENGIIFRKEWFKTYTETPMMFEKVVLSCDLSNQDTSKSDFAAFQVWGKDGGDFYLLGRGKKRCSFNEQVSIVKAFLLKYPKINLVLIELRATGTAMVEFLQKEIDVTVKGYDPKYVSKESRASTASILFEGGHVFIPTEKMDATIENYKQELMGFPNLAHDDEVDATSQALLYMSERACGGVYTDNVLKDIRGMFRFGGRRA